MGSGGVSKLPNLGKLSKSLQAFVELVQLDSDWLAAAAQASPHQQATQSHHWKTG
jgi:hypothetical protein